jgi:DNA-directed RNA polymerase subunit RPC12/RpoP
MSYHIRLKEYHCPKCQAEYIPFAEDVKCPKCDFLDRGTSEYWGFVDQIINSMKAHKIEYGRYVPPGWHMGSASESMQYVCMDVFDDMERSGWIPNIMRLHEMLRHEWPEHQSKNVMGLVLAVYEKYGKDKWFRNGPTFKERWRYSLGRFLL